MASLFNSNNITLTNDLKDKEVRVKEGNAGVTRTLTTLKPGKSFVMKNDSNATYREYIFIIGPDEKPLKVVTSDDFAEFKEIKIYEDEDGYDWVGIPKTAPPPAVVKPSGEDTSTSQTGPRWRVFLRRIGIRL